MRPIDADELKNDLHERGFLPVIVTRAIDNAPILTADDLREKGEWVKEDELVFHCNKCGSREFFKSNYCPTCGAKMGGGE